MDRRVLMFCCFGAFSCGDPSDAYQLQVVVELGAGPLADRIQRVGFEIYLIGDRDQTIDCDQIAFAEVAPFPDFSFDLADDANDGVATVPRVGSKLLVVRAYDDSGRAVLAGCAETDTIESDSSLTIAVEPTTSATLERQPGTDGDEFRRWTVDIRDALGNQRLDIPARWESFGAGQLRPFSEEVFERIKMADESERLLFEILERPPSGPFRVRVRTRWEVEDATRFVFVPPMTREYVVGPRASVSYVAHEQSVVASYATVEGDTVLVVYDGLERRSETIPGLWSLGRSSQGVFVVSMSSVRRLGIEATGLKILPAEPFASGTASVPSQIYDLSACSEDSPLALIGADGHYRLFDRDFTYVPQPDLEALTGIVSTGCMADAAGAPRRLIDRYGEGDRRLSFASASGLGAAVRGSSAEQFAFSGQWSREWATPVAVSTVVRDRDFVLQTHARVTPDLGLRVDNRETVLGGPVAVESGDLDGNSVEDLVVLTQLSAEQQALFVILRGDGSNEAAAAFELGTAFRDPWLAVVDLDSGDGHPNIVVADRQPGVESTLKIFTLGPSNSPGS